MSQLSGQAPPVQRQSLQGTAVTAVPFGRVEGTFFVSAPRTRERALVDPLFVYRVHGPYRFPPNENFHSNENAVLKADLS
jgi:hypothetical protein